MESEGVEVQVKVKVKCTLVQALSSVQAVRPTGRVEV